MQDGVQTYSCKDCGKRFRSPRREKTSLILKIAADFVFHKQTFRELREIYGIDWRIIRDLFQSYQPLLKEHRPRAIHLVVDATYFGERKEKTSWCIVAFRDSDEKENLWWTYTDQETESLYREGREYLEKLGYIILSVTGDGLGLIRIAFSGIPFQMCHVHMERIIIRGTTRNPILEAGQVILALTRTLKYTDQGTFTRRFDLYIEKYRDFLNQKSINPETGKTDFTHRELRRVALSLKVFLPFLFTYEKDKRIPKTTNTLEGHFSHIKDVVGIHRGLSRPLKEKVLTIIMLASTIAPKEKKGEKKRSKKPR